MIRSWRAPVLGVLAILVAVAAWADGTMRIRTSGGQSARWDQRAYARDAVWVYQPLRKPLPPRTGHPIDAFLAARRPDGLAPAPPAERRELLRRVTFDLTGLPPTLSELEQFQADRRPLAAAFRSLVDRLLASPHYGERMAQHWLDVVRYADSSGFANDYQRGSAWRYRDYIVRSFNQDRPYDQFVRQQIAGDELDAADPENLIAVGFLRMGPWELTGMEVPRIARQRFLDDVTNSVGETFLGHSLQCARCHDHKFDPVPTRDYYAVQAVFATTQLCERPAPFLSAENTAGFEERQFLEQRREQLHAVLADLDARSLAAADRWFAERMLDRTAWDQARRDAERQPNRRRGSLFNSARGLLLQRGVNQDAFPPRMLGWTPQEMGMERIANKGLERLAWELDRYQPFALSVYSGRTPRVTSVNAPVRPPADPWSTGDLEQTTILAGGSPFAPSDPVQPGVISAASAPAGGPEWEQPTGRRRRFAEWVTSPRNPLTPRVMANRIWQWHFGQALAGNPNNLGSTGKRPTHPELLDWLAATLVEKRWSIKELHRVILSSSAYLQSTRHPRPDRLRLLDPAGKTYSAFQPRRLSAEELRDAMLAATGELNRVVGGIPVRPELNPEVAFQPRQVMGTFAAAWVPSARPEQRHRRSLYALRLRGQMDPFLEVFNAPGPDLSCERRETSLGAPQVFQLFNGADTRRRALALAARAAREAKGDTGQVIRCYQLALGRSPAPAELADSLRHWRETVTELRPAPAPESLPKEILREAIEENTGERFTFKETLHGAAEFVPDLQPHQVSPSVRALAELCLVLLNSNEFVYVD